MGRGTDFKQAGGRKFDYSIVSRSVAIQLWRNDAHVRVYSQALRWKYHNRQGIVRHIFSSQFAPQIHVAEALKVLKELSEENT